MGSSKRGKLKSPTWESGNPPSGATLEASSAGLALVVGLLSQLSRFLIKNGDSLAEEVHVSCVVSGIAAAAVWISGAGGKQLTYTPSRLRRLSCYLYCFVSCLVTVGGNDDNEKKKKK